MIIIPKEFKYKVGQKVFIPCGDGTYMEKEVIGLTRKTKGLFRKRLTNYYLYNYAFNIYLVEEDKILKLERN